MSVGKNALRRGMAADWQLTPDRAAAYVVAVALVLLFGQRGWLLWHHGRAVLAWMLSSGRLMLRDARWGQPLFCRHGQASPSETR